MLAPVLAGCISMPGANPAIGITEEQASAELARLESAPKPLDRPVVMLNGYRAPWWHIDALTANLARATSADRSRDFLEISYPFTGNFDDLALEVIRRVEERWPSADPARTVEVDVVGVSMGGVVARWAAMPGAERSQVRGGHGESRAGKSLRIRRLFTLASPHGGAHLATLIAPDGAASDMRPGSRVLESLNSPGRNSSYEMICYAHLRDFTVGATKAAPPGMNPIWTGGTLLFSHSTVVEDVIFIADIAKRLRGEPALVEPAGPPDGD